MNSAWRRRRAKRELRDGAIIRRHTAHLRLTDIYGLGYDVRMVPKAPAEQVAA